MEWRAMFAWLIRSKEFMKYFMLLIQFFLVSLVFAQGDAPTTMKGQFQGTKSPGTKIVLPNKQATKISASEGQIETGNKNRLENPGRTSTGNHALILHFSRHPP